MNKVKYTWTLMHGDADHYDKESLTLSNPDEIAFFDYVIKLPFESYCHKGFDFDDEEVEDSRRIELIELYKKTKMYKEDIDNWPEDKNDNERILEWIDGLLYDWDYFRNDVTCDGMHYADIRNVVRKEIIPDNEPKDKELLDYALTLLNLNKNQLIEKYKINK